MRILEYAVGVIIVSLILGIAIVVSAHPSSAGATPICYTFHRAVVIVPAVCAKHDICETAIEAKVCDSVLIRGAKR